MHQNLLAFLLILGLLLPKTPQGKLLALAELGAAVSMGSVQIGEQKAPQVQANVLAAVPLLKRLFGGKQGNKGAGAATKPTEPTPQPEWFNAMAAGMKFTIYDENGVQQYSQTVDVGTVPPEEWGKLMQTFTAPMSGLLEVEIFNYNINFPVYFDDWHITLTENPKPEIVQEVAYDPWGLVMQDESYFKPEMGVTPPSGAGGLFLFNGKELQTYADLHLYDYHWRQYDPQLGRWHNIDPSADKYHGFSPYNYCFNNPVMVIDPDGRDPFTVAVIIGAVIGAYSGYQTGKAAGATGWGLVGYTLAGAGIGAATAGIGSYVGGAAATGLGLSANATTFWGAVGYGAVSGAVGGVVGGGLAGGFFSLLGGGNFWEGAASGAAWGGGLGAVGGAISGGIGFRIRTVQAARKMLIKGQNPNSPVEMTNESLTNFVKSHEELNALYEKANNPTLIAGQPSNEYVLSSDGYFTKGDGNMVGGTTSVTDGTIRVAPKVFQKAVRLYMTVGHELHHSMHIRNGVYGIWTATGGSDFARNMSETVAHKWAWQLGKRIGMTGINSSMFHHHNNLLPQLHRIKLNFLRP